MKTRKEIEQIVFGEAPNVFGDSAVIKQLHSIISPKGLSGDEKQFVDESIKKVQEKIKELTSR